MVILNSNDKTILSILYVCQLNGNSTFEAIRKNSIISKEEINFKIDELTEKQLVNVDRRTLTEIGRRSLCVVLTGGIFDIIHPGHIQTLNAAKALGDVLVVVVGTDTNAVKKKKDIIPSQDERKELVNSLSMVDLCLMGQESSMFNTVNRVKPDIIALDYDQLHQEKFITEGCKKINLGVKVVRLQSLNPKISSFNIKKEYGNDIHKT